jgi:L-ascorbate metabolism protein UlaG (beta-lactamase superfamily)
MVTRIVTAGLVLFLVNTGLAQKKASVTYVGNEGFLITTGHGKILTDALFGGIKGNWCEQPSDSVLNLQVNGQPPFDNIDAVLVSHCHADHFNEKVVSEFMVKNPAASLVCPDQVHELLKNNTSYPLFSARVIVLHFSHQHDTSFAVGEIRIRAIRMNHGSYFEKDTLTGELQDLHRDVVNACYLVTSAHCTFFHSGDASVKSFGSAAGYGLGSEKVDFAFFDRVFMQPDGMKRIEEVMNPDKLIFMHIEPSRVNYYRNIVSGFPALVIFSKPMETVSMP